MPIRTKFLPAERLVHPQILDQAGQAVQDA